MLRLISRAWSHSYILYFSFWANHLIVWSSICFCHFFSEKTISLIMFPHLAFYNTFLVPLWPIDLIWVRKKKWDSSALFTGPIWRLPRARNWALKLIRLSNLSDRFSCLSMRDFLGKYIQFKEKEIYIGWFETLIVKFQV